MLDRERHIRVVDYHHHVGLAQLVIAAARFLSNGPSQVLLLCRVPRRSLGLLPAGNLSMMSMSRHYDWCTCSL